MYDIVIIGAGPAGLTAAIYALRANKTVLILERSAFGGQMTFSPKIENYPGFESLSGSELADKMVSQVLLQGADVEIDQAKQIKNEDGHFSVVTEDGNTYDCRAVIVACGVKHRHLGLENEDRFIGDGISFCAVCDGAFYKNKTVAIVGGGNSALQEALLLSETSKKVYIIQNLDFLTGEKKLQALIEKRGNMEVITGTTVSAILGQDTFEGIRVKGVSDSTESELKLDGLFVAIGLEPENNDFSNVAQLNSSGYFDSDEHCLTVTPGVFVAGDCRNKSVRQISTATADGATAAIAACRYIDMI